MPYSLPHDRLKSTESSRPLGAILYLLRSHRDDIGHLSRSLRALKQNVLSSNPYPVLCFHESSLLNDVPLHKLLLATCAASGVPVFLNLVNFSFPRAQAERMWAKDVEPVIFRSGKHWPMGYRHMCRFFSGPFAFHPALLEYGWAWRMDTDSEVTRPIENDQIGLLRNAGALYGCVGQDRERLSVAARFENATLEYFGHNFSRSVLGVRFAKDYFGRLPTFASNMEIISLEWVRSTAFMNFFDFLDRQGGFYLYRWGDALTRWFAVKLLRAEHVRPLNITYVHGSTGEGRKEQVHVDDGAKRREVK